jgi:hypothetical protein
VTRSTPPDVLRATRPPCRSDGARDERAATARLDARGPPPHLPAAHRCRCAAGLRRLRPSGRGLLRPDDRRGARCHQAGRTATVAAIGTQAAQARTSPVAGTPAHPPSDRPATRHDAPCAAAGTATARDADDQPGRDTAPTERARRPTTTSTRAAIHDTRAASRAQADGRRKNRRGAGVVAARSNAVARPPFRPGGPAQSIPMWNQETNQLLTVPTPRPLFARLKATASERETTMSAIVRELIAAFLEEQPHDR